MLASAALHVHASYHGLL